MRGVILAAGVGSRLRPITDQKPKTMVEVNGRPMIRYLVDALVKGGVEEIVICTGYRAEAIERYCVLEFPETRFRFIRNEEYQVTNNMYSLYLAREYLDDDFILMNADLVFLPAVIRKVLASPSSCVAVDRGTYNEESMKIVVGDSGRIESISKKISRESAYGSSIDVYKILRKDSRTLLDEMDRIIRQGGDRNSWTEVMLDNLFRSGRLPAVPLDINPEPWFEIDNFEDLAKAEVLFNERLPELGSKRVVFFDNDGTLSVDGDPLAGANVALEKLRAAGKQVFLLTNNSSRTPREHQDSLKRMGINFRDDEIVTSLDACLTSLGKEGYDRIFWIANRSVSSYIESRGFEYSEIDPKAVLLTFDTEIDYSKFRTALRLLRGGLPFYATHIDLVYPIQDGFLPDIGCFLQTIENCCGRKPLATFGKPDTRILQPVLDRVGASLKDAVMIGDRLYTDIRMGEGNDLTTVLVLSGETNRANYEEASIRAEIVVPSIQEIVKWLLK